MTAPKLRSAGERLQLARAEVPKVEARIDAVMERRRALLLEGDANALACVNADRELVRLHALKLRLHAQIELLSRAGPVVAPAPEPTGWTWPTSLADAKQALLEVEPQIVRMGSVPRVDRSAAFDAHLDFLTKRQYSLTKLIMNLQPKETGA
jgi:hypothetical protein